MKKGILLLLAILTIGCEQPTEYVLEYVNTETILEVEVEKEIIITEYIDVEIIPEKEVIVTEYIDREIIITKYIEVDKIVTVITEVEVETIVEVEKIVNVEVIEYIDNIVYNETIVYITKEIYIMTEEEIIVDPIKEYDNYITTTNKVLGVTAGGFEEIPLIKDLFKIDGVIYFSIDDKNYKQENGAITELETLPTIPESKHFEFESGSYKIQNAKYKDDDISKVYNSSPNVAYYMVDGACLRGSDLIYSTPTDTGSRLKGVYLWTVNGNPQLQTVLGEGRIW